MNLAQIPSVLAQRQSDGTKKLLELLEDPFHEQVSLTHCLGSTIGLISKTACSKFRLCQLRNLGRLHPSPGRRLFLPSTLQLGRLRSQTQNRR